MVLLLSVFCVLSFVLMPFLFIAFHRGLQSHSTLLCLCSPESLHSIRPSFPACLPTYLESPSSHPHHLPAPVCTINLHFTTSCLRCLHLGPKIQSQPLQSLPYSCKKMKNYTGGNYQTLWGHFHTQLLKSSYFEPSSQFFLS